MRIAPKGFESGRPVATRRGRIYVRGSREPPVPRMEVQIFGLKKSAETRKAIRFFSERRIRAHFVDLAERDISAGELQRFIQRFGLDGVMDRTSKRVDQLGLRHSNMSEARWVDRLLVEPTMLRLPLVRRLGQPPAITVGDSEDTWRDWVDSATTKPS